MRLKHAVVDGTDDVRQGLGPHCQRYRTIGRVTPRAHVDEYELQTILFAGCGDASCSGPALWRHKPLKSLFQLTRDLDAHEVTIFRADDLDAHRKA